MFPKGVGCIVPSEGNIQFYTHFPRIQPEILGNNWKLYDLESSQEANL